MKPQFLSIPQADGTFHAFLVDADLVFIKPEDGIGDARINYATALNLRGCTAGQIEVAAPDETGEMQILAPWPCVVCIRKTDKMNTKKAGLAARGIDPRAAVVLLRLAASVQNIQVPFTGSAGWTFGESIQRTDDPDVMAGATPAKIIAAWKWSRWIRTGTKGGARLAEMKSIG